MQTNSVEIHKMQTEPWKVTMLYTGEKTMTGSRIKLAREHIGNERFLLTYGDGVSDVDVNKLIDFHKKSGKTVTLTAIQPGGKFGVLDIDETDTINQFTEKGKEDGGWINGGFMVVEPEIFKYLDDDESLIFERKPLETLASEGKLGAYKHDGFWQCMDTLRDKMYLERLVANGEAPWVVW
jgi:glucose-1-phosphate cytidylyltransferase